MTVTLLLLACALALVVYGIARSLPWHEPAPPPVRKRGWLYPVEVLLQAELDRARLSISPSWLLWSMGAAGAAGLALVWPLQSEPVRIIAGLASASLPLLAVRGRVARRQREVMRAVEPALVLLARLCEVRSHPFLAIADALPMLEPPLRAEFERAVAEVHAGSPLPLALREVAGRLGDDFYLHQLAELVEINIRTGSDLPGSLTRLAERLRTLEEIQAEERAELLGYRWLTRLLFLGGLAPVIYWSATGSPSLDIFHSHPLAQALLVWALVSGLVIISLPYWLAVEE